MNSRIHSILGIVELKDRIIENFNINLSDIKEIDYEKVNAKLEHEREEGKKFLYNAILSKEI